MAEKPIIYERFPSNSREEKVVEEPVPEKKFDQVVSGKVTRRKKSFGRKFSETFIAEDVSTVRENVTQQVIVPAIKELVADVVNDTIERVLGVGRRRSHFGSSSNQNRPRLNYSQLSREASNKPKQNLSYRARATHDFDEIVFENIGEAQFVLERLGDAIATYERATVADLYDLIGLTSKYTDKQWGWEDISTADVTRVRGGGYILDLPKPIELD